MILSSISVWAIKKLWCYINFILIKFHSCNHRPKAHIWRVRIFQTTDSPREKCGLTLCFHRNRKWSSGSFNKSSKVPNIRWLGTEARTADPWPPCSGDGHRVGTEMHAPAPHKHWLLHLPCSLPTSAVDGCVHTAHWQQEKWSLSTSIFITKQAGIHSSRLIH